MSNNIFMEDRSPISFEEYLQFNENGRGNLGDMLPVTVYRMLEYSIKEELVNNFGKEKQIEIFRKAGRKSGEYFAKNMMNLDQPLDSFLSELQRKLEEFKIGVLRIEQYRRKEWENHIDRIGRCGLFEDFRFLARLYVIMMKDLFPEFYLYIQIGHMKPLK